MKVLHAINALETGGAENFVCDLSVALRESGAESDIAVLWEGEGRAADCARAESLRVIPIGSGRKFSFGAISSLRRLGARYDIVHAHLFPSQWYAAMAFSGRERPALVLTEHNSANGRMRVAVLRPWERAMYRRYDRVVCVSNDVERIVSAWVSLSAEKTCMIPVGIPLPPLASNATGDTHADADDNRLNRRLAARRLLGVSADAPLVVMVCRLVRQKGIDLAIEAVSRIEDATLVVVGDGIKRPELERQAASLGTRIRFLGYRSDVHAVLPAADVFLATSHYEGIPIAVMEAMSEGLAVVATDAPGLRESVWDGETGLLVPRTTEDVARALRQLLSDRERTYRMGCAARVRVRQFSIETTAKRYRDLYAELLSERGASRSV